MRIYETKRDDLNEGPLDLLTPSGRERRRAFKTGKQVSSTAIKQLGNEFARYLGTQGKKNFNQADTQDVIAFLKSKGVDTSDVDTTQPMNQKRIENIFKQKVQQTTSLNKSTPASPAASAQPSSAPAAPASSTYTQTKTSAMKLSAKEKRRLIQQLQKGLPATKVPPIPLGRGRSTPPAA